MQVQIRVKGHLDLFWQGWFEGLQITHLEDGTSLLIGTLRDQAALYGVLWKIRDQGIALLTLTSSPVEGMPEVLSTCGKDHQTNSKMTEKGDIDIWRRMLLPDSGMW